MFGNKFKRKSRASSNAEKNGAAFLCPGCGQPPHGHQCQLEGMFGESDTDSLPENFEMKTMADRTRPTFTIIEDVFD